MTTVMRAELNENQKNSLRITMRSLNDTVYKLQTLLPQDGVRETFFEWKNRLTPDQKALAEEWIIRIRAALERFKEHYALPMERDDPFHDAIAMLERHRVDLEECHSSRLIGFGSVDPRLKLTLDPELEELDRMTKGLIRTFAI